MKSQIQIAFILLISIVLASCASEVSLTHPAQIVREVFTPPIVKALDETEALKVFKPEPIFIQQKGPVGTIKSDETVHVIRGLQTKDLTIEVDFNNFIPQNDKPFKTQALRCADFVKLKVQITGIGIVSPLFPAGVDGNDNISASAGCTIAATIANVPFGSSRIATVAAYQADGTTVIPGSTVKAAFNITTDPTNVNIGFNTTPTGEVVESLIGSDAFIASYINLATLQTFVDGETGISGTFPDYSYTYHPSMVDSTQMATDLNGNGGNIGGLTAGDYDNVALSSVTGTLAGLLGTDTASIQVTDPASPISINNGNGAFSFTSNVTPGTWVVHAEAPGYTADVTPATTIAAGATDPVGTITFTWANTPNITGLSSSAEPIGTSININGTDFHPEIAGNAVTFNGVAATVTAASPTQLTVTVPNATDGNVIVTVGTVASNGVNFDVMPTISITAPTNASVVNGNSVSITTNFTSGNPVGLVEFFLDGTGGTSLGTDNTGPTYTLNFDSTAYVSGAHTLVARITDGAVNQAVSAAINITIDQPPNVGTPTSNTATAPGLSYPIQVQTSSTDDITTLVDATYTWSCIANCGDSSFSQTDSPQVIWTAPSTDQGAAATIQVSVDDGVNTPVTDTINLGYTVGLANVNVVGNSYLQEVSTYAGFSGALTNGSLIESRFSFPAGVDFDSSGNLYVADRGNDVIRKIGANGVVSTLAGSGVGGFNDATGAAAQFENPYDVAVDSTGNVFVADQLNHIIRKITPAGVVTTFAGQQGSPGFANNTGTLAQFDQPYGIAVDGSDNLYVADYNNHRIRKITNPGAVVTTFAGNGNLGFVDGAAGIAEFKRPVGIDVDGAGNVYVVGILNHAVRKITAGGVVSTLAGSGSAGFVNGTGGAAQFDTPRGVAVDSAGNIFVTDYNNHVIRKVTAAGVVTTFAGTGTSGTTNGLRANAKFQFPFGIAIDAADMLYIGDQNSHRIRRIRQ